jgi:hypothetical protein
VRSSYKAGEFFIKNTFKAEKWLEKAFTKFLQEN